jgi:formate dehydrogenase subunit gamma
MVHSIANLLMIVVFLTHIYIGTIGMRGALSAMKEGYVDDEWAAEHHELWYQDIRDGKIPAQRTPEAQPAPHAIQP